MSHITTETIFRTNPQPLPGIGALSTRATVTIRSTLLDGVLVGKGLADLTFIVNSPSLTTPLIKIEFGNLSSRVVASGMSVAVQEVINALQEVLDEIDAMPFVPEVVDPEEPEQVDDAAALRRIADRLDEATVYPEDDPMTDEQGRRVQPD